MTATDVALTTETRQLTVTETLARLVPEVERALPAGMDADRLIRLATTVIRQSDIEARKAGKPQNSLNNCAPESFVGALLTSAALGLEPGVNGEAWLVPYKGECTLIIGYQGYAKLFWQHPLARHLDAQPVYENDEFDYAYGLNQSLRHKPARGNRGKVTDYYAVAELTSGASAFVVLTADEVKRLRGGKTGPSGQIPDPMRWMERKTALRQLFKLVPKSVKLAAAIVVDEQTGTILATRGVAGSIAAGDGVQQLEPARPDDEPQDRITNADIEQQAQPAARMVSAAQRNKLMALYAELGVTDRDERLADAGNYLTRDLGSFNELTLDEAKLLIDHLETRSSPS